METKGLINDIEIGIARECIEIAEKAGASAVRASLSKTVSNGINILDGEIDKITYSEERSIFLHIFADGRYGRYSTNKLDADELKAFIRNAVDMTRLLAADPCRTLPNKEVKAKGCTGGNELGLYDIEYHNISPEQRIESALAACNRKGMRSDEWTLESSEEEYSDSLDDNYMADSDGFEGRHIETSYAYCAETTIKDKKGNRYSGYWWDASPYIRDFDFSSVGGKALERAVMHINPIKAVSGLYDTVIDRSCAQRLISPLIQALDMQNVQQNNSFLAGKLGETIFSRDFDLYDSPLERGCPGSRMFDIEGVATANRHFIKDGAVTDWLVNTYMSKKTGLHPTIGDISRPCIRAHICNCSKNEINLENICRHIGNGLYVTDFNGGNCNTATGNFSFGVEGLLIRDGKLAGPVKEMLMTGNIIQLWQNLVAAGSDARKCARWQMPTLAFKDVMINV